MRTHIYIVLAAIMALPLMTRAEDTVVPDTLEVTMDSVVIAEDSVPEWYIPAEIPAELRAPMRANAGTCLTDSILTFNADSVLTETTIFEYDAANRAIRTIVWKYDATGILSTSSKQEYAYDASGTQIYTGTFAWDTNTNDWRGTAKSEFVYNEAHKMESNITYTWVNNTWLPSQALTYAYDAAGRETEFTTYTRNASANRLVPSKQRLQTWYNASKKTLEINYTAYSNGAWSAGNKKEYAYDSNGNQIEYTYYSSYSAGNWVGSTQEFWTYNASNKKTLYEKYTFSNNAWAITTREITGYDAAGNTILIENYALKSGVLSGSKKEEYTYNAAKKKLTTIKYRWSNNDWLYNTKAVNDYNDAGNTIETADYVWINNAWTGTGTRILKTYNSAKQVIEQIDQTWSTEESDWVNSARQTTLYSSSQTLQEAIYTWSGIEWIGVSRNDYHYNAEGQNDTTKTYTSNGFDWIYSARTVNTYDSRGNTILTHNASWRGNSWLMTSMTRFDIAYNEYGSTTLSANYHCSSDSIWIGDNKSMYVYDAANKMIESYQYQWGLDHWNDYIRVLWDYDAADHKILEERCLYTEGNWMGDYKIVAAYDSYGHQTLTERYSWSNGHWVGSYKYSYLYDDHGNKLEDWTYSWKDSLWLPSLSHLISYDAQNRKIEDIVSRMSTSTGFSPEIKYVYVYGTNNLLTLQNDYSWADGVWLLRTQNEKTYDSIDNKLRRELQASYRNGICQSYRDNHYFYSCDAPASNGSQPRTPTDIEEIDENNGTYENNAQPFDPTQPTYNLSGQRVDPASYHGIVIQGGKTYLIP